MESDTLVRDQITSFLKGGQAYAPFDEIVAKFPSSKMNALFPNGTYTPWHLLEHIRRTQEDILNFMTDPHYTSPSWPADYWPEHTQTATLKIWENTITHYKNDLKKIVAMVNNPKINIYQIVPQGTTQTYLREFLLVAQHTAYHLGEFSIMRQTMNTWNSDH